MIVTLDIDHTLVVGTKTHHQALEHGIYLTYGVKTQLQGRNFTGYVDKQIVLEALSTEKISEQEIEAGFVKLCESSTQFYLENVSSEKISVLPGVKPLLQKLLSSGYRLGLVTGNIEGIAHAKLKAAGLPAIFKFGGYGCEDTCRGKLLGMALERASHSKDSVAFHIGDTVQDIRASVDNGAYGIGVGTGATSTRSLMEAGASSVFPDLSDTDSILHALKLWTVRHKSLLQKHE